MGVQPGAPPDRAVKAPAPDWTALIDAAAAAPGEWFNQELPEMLPQHNVSGSLSFAISKRVAEFATRQGVVYLRWLLEEEQ